MVYLSYSSMNSLQQAPHTWINKVNGLKTRTSPAFEAGKKIHRIVQDSVCGVKPHPMLVDLPQFEEVEVEDFDPKMKIEKKFNDKYSVHGYIDLKSPSRKEFGDVKSGAAWSLQKMYKHPQFAIYYWALDYKDFVLINLPKEEKLWNFSNIQVYKMSFTDAHKRMAAKFIEDSIEIIENIDEAVKKEDFSKSRRACYYINCPFCNEEKN